MPSSTYELQIPIEIWMIIAGLLPLVAIQYAKHVDGFKLTIWKQLACLVLFELSFTPYAFIISVSSGVYSWLNMGYFLLIWILFYLANFLLPLRLGAVASVILGLLLLAPASTFLTISDGHFSFDFGPSHTIDVAYQQNIVKALLQDVFKFAWATFPLLGVHWLMRQKR